MSIYTSNKFLYSTNCLWRTAGLYFSFFTILNLYKRHRNCTEGTLQLFANDTRIVSEVSSLSKLELKWNHELENVTRWVIVNKLTVNPYQSYNLLILFNCKHDDFSIILNYNMSNIRIVLFLKYREIRLANKLLFKHATY